MVGKPDLTDSIHGNRVKKTQFTHYSTKIFKHKKKLYTKSAMIIQEIQVKKKIKKTIAIYSTKYINKTSNKKKNEEKNRTQETLNRLVSQSHMN